MIRQGGLHLQGEEARAFYDEYWRERESLGRIHVFEDAWIPPRVELALQLLKDTLKGDSFSCLDVGCGEGTFGKVARGEFGDNCTLVGIDISGLALKFARSYYDSVAPCDVERHDIASCVGAQSASFDYIVCLETLEHLFRPERALAQFRTLLKPHGWLIASFPNIVFWRYRIDFARGHFPPTGYYLYHPAEHVQHFTLPAMRRLLSQEGFRLEQVKAHVVLPRALRPRRFFMPMARRWPGLFGYQIVVLARLA